MSRPRLTALSFCMLVALGNSAMASGGGEEGGGKVPAIELSKGVKDMVLHPASGISDPVPAIRLNVTQFSYPGVPERASCRTVIRVENGSPATIAFYTLIRTFDGEKQPLGTWMTPSGKLAPGESSERLYSCKIARYMVLDRGSAGGWPNTCHIDGIDRTPCPIELTFDVNIDFLPDSAPAPGKADAKH
ncbi:hypothetical protein [Magnetospirillum sulfuroxidans]|uniref:Secreted protein n=1 Tax=Magnetospirillum sulfuroxidans TaxID=611300 RepID=A0ABS5IB20_9PROT|nr:hypothetical protein [Magnetospirillum sulfuroxidans]MBR9970908.1 hypothetical protein [Magnetospirillum sulfuroxidans]